MASDQDIYREWLRRQLEARGRGSRAELARFLGLSTPNPISRMLNTDGSKETRQISASELGRMAIFFKKTPPMPLSNLSDQEPDLEEEAMAIYRQLSDAGKRRFLARVLGLEEPGQSEQPSQAAHGPIGPKR